MGYYWNLDFSILFERIEKQTRNSTAQRAVNFGIIYYLFSGMNKREKSESLFLSETYLRSCIISCSHDLVQAVFLAFSFPLAWILDAIFGCAAFAGYFSACGVVICFSAVRHLSPLSYAHRFSAVSFLMPLLSPLSLIDICLFLWTSDLSWHFSVDYCAKIALPWEGVLLVSPHKGFLGISSLPSFSPVFQFLLAALLLSVLKISGK